MSRFSRALSSCIKNESDLSEFEGWFAQFLESELSITLNKGKREAKQASLLGFANYNQLLGFARSSRPDELVKIINQIVLVTGVTEVNLVDSHSATKSRQIAQQHYQQISELVHLISDKYSDLLSDTRICTRLMNSLLMLGNDYPLDGVDLLDESASIQIQQRVRQPLQHLQHILCERGLLIYCSQQRGDIDEFWGMTDSAVMHHEHVQGAQWKVTITPNDESIEDKHIDSAMRQMNTAFTDHSSRGLYSLEDPASEFMDYDYEAGLSSIVVTYSQNFRGKLEIERI